MKSNEQRRLRSECEEKQDRLLRRLDKERQELWRQLREAPWRELKEPFQRGWERRFVLRADARRRKDGEQLEQALRLIENYQRCRVFPFRQYDWKRKGFAEWPHQMGFLTSSEVRSGRVPLELVKHFQTTRNRPLTDSRVRGILRAEWGGQFWFRYPEYAVSETRPFMVTHKRVALPEVEARLAEVESILREPPNQGRLWNLRGYSHRRWDRFMHEEEDRKRARLEMKEAVEVVQDFHNREGDFQPERRSLAYRLEVFFQFSNRSKHQGIVAADWIRHAMKFDEAGRMQSAATEIRSMKSVLEKTIVLVLNRNWQAIDVTTPQEAFASMVTDAATGLDIHGPDWMVPVRWKDWRALPVREGDFSIGTVSGPIRVPTVVVLSRFDRVPMKRPSFSLKGLWERDGGRCQYTGRVLKPGEGNIDHVIPRSRGGETSWENCVLSDRVVNNRKADKTPKEAGLSLLTHPYRPPEVPVTHLLRNSYQIPEWEVFLPKKAS